MQKILGLILELNPAHNGHQYFINEAKRLVNPDVTIAILSSSFTMRGDVSVIDKFTKTKLALEMGVDIVLELPFLCAINSADLFAYNAVKNLTDMQITDLCFGVELDDITKLIAMKDIINSDSYQDKVRNYLAHGSSYSSSSFKALIDLADNQELIDNFTLPNNTLGLQYLRSLEDLNKKVKITLVKRISNNYYDQNTTGPISSATAIRQILRMDQPPNEYIPSFQTKINFIDEQKACENLFFALKYIFTTTNLEKIQSVFGVSEGIENRIANMLDEIDNYHELIKTIQTKRYPQNKIKRLLLHIIMNTNKKYEDQVHSYLRVLGINTTGKEYLNTLPKNIKKQIITTFKNQFDNEIVQNEFQATKLYGLITNQPKIYLEEFKIPIIGGSNEH